MPQLLFIWDFYHMTLASQGIFEISVSVSHVQSSPGLLPHTHPKIHKKLLKMTHTAGGNCLEKEHGCIVTILVPQKSSAANSMPDFSASSVMTCWLFLQSLQVWTWKHCIYQQQSFTPLADHFNSYYCIWPASLIFQPWVFQIRDRLQN